MEFPTGSGHAHLARGRAALARRLINIFLRDPAQGGRRAVFGGNDFFQSDPHWRDYIPFQEYFNGDRAPASAPATRPAGPPWWLALIMDYCGKTEWSGRDGAEKGKRKPEIRDSKHVQMIKKRKIPNKLLSNFDFWIADLNVSGGFGFRSSDCELLIWPDGEVSECATNYDVIIIGSGAGGGTLRVTAPRARAS